MLKEFNESEVIYQEKCMNCPKFNKKLAWCMAFDEPAEAIKECNIWDYPTTIKKVVLNSGSAKVKL